MKNTSVLLVLGLIAAASWLFHIHSQSEPASQEMTFVRSGESFSGGNSARSKRVRNNIKPMDGEIEGATPSEIALAGKYRQFAEKGKFVKGARITIVTEKLRYKIDEPVRVIHIQEFLPSNEYMFVLPRPICDEYVDGRLARGNRSSGRNCGSISITGSPIAGPFVNWSFEITTYRFSKPGEHTIQWKLDMGKDRLCESNLLKLQVDPRDA